MNKTNQPFVSVVVLNWNGKHLLEECLPSVVAAAQEYSGGAEVVVSDNGSADGSLDFLRDEFPTVRIVSLEKNFGFQTGCNQGIDATQAEYIVLLNNDVAVDKDFITPLVGLLIEKPDAFAVTPKTFYWDRQHVFCSTIAGEFRKGRFVQIWAISRDLQDICDQKVPSVYVSGGAMAFRKSIFNALGQFDLLYYPIYWEDTDLSFQAWKRGYTLWYEPKSIVYHKVSATMQLHKFSHHLNLRRNEYLFVWRNFTDAALLMQHFILLPFSIIDSGLRAARGHKVSRWWALWTEYKAFFSALGQIREIRRRRKEDKKFCKLSDREVLRLSDWRSHVKVHTKPPVLRQLHPNNTPPGQGFNLQPDGSSALAVECEGATADTVIYFGKHPLETTFGGPNFLTAKVPQKYLKRPKSHEVCLKNSGGESEPVVFSVEHRT